MTREEQIHNQATNYGYAVAGGSTMRPPVSKAFLEGAKWADANNLDNELVFNDFLGNEIKCRIKDLIHRYKCLKRSVECYQDSNFYQTWGFMGRQIGDDFQPNIPKTTPEKYAKYIIPALHRIGAIPKSELVEGKSYKGYCRNSSTAVWKGSYFEYEREKFGSTFIEKINHFEDDNGLDLFVPYKEL